MEPRDALVEKDDAAPMNKAVHQGNVTDPDDRGERGRPIWRCPLCRFATSYLRWSVAKERHLRRAHPIEGMKFRSRIGWRERMQATTSDRPLLWQCPKCPWGIRDLGDSPGTASIKNAIRKHRRLEHPGEPWEHFVVYGEKWKFAMNSRNQRIRAAARARFLLNSKAGAGVW